MNKLFFDPNSLCGCGKPSRYLCQSDGEIVHSCNKYRRCASYEELSQAFSHANATLNAYRLKRKYDGLNGREWDAAEHFKAEARIEELEAKHVELIAHIRRLFEQELAAKTGG